MMLGVAKNFSGFLEQYFLDVRRELAKNQL